MGYYMYGQGPSKYQPVRKKANWRAIESIGLLQVATSCYLGNGCWGSASAILLHVENWRQGPSSLATEGCARVRCMTERAPQHRRKLAVWGLGVGWRGWTTAGWFGLASESCKLYACEPACLWCGAVRCTVQDEAMTPC